jgi:hypothetical protein
MKNSSPTRWLIPAVCLLLSGSLLVTAERDEHKRKKTEGGTLPPAATKPISYTKDVKPLFEENCFGCHAGGEHKGGYRMDTQAQILKIVSKGNSAKSKLVRMTAGLVEKDEIMPPKDGLKPAEVGILRAWIDQGAKFDEKPAVKPAK